MVLTECELRELWRDGKGALPAFPPGTRLSPSARDFLQAHRLQLRFDAGPAEDARTESDSPERPPEPNRPARVRPGTRPSAFSAPQPVCAACGQPLGRFRGRMESLHAAALLVGAHARKFNLPELADRLSTLAAYCREITSAEYHGRPVAELSLDDKSEAEIHDIAHPLPGPEDHEILLWLNWFRAQVREAELLAHETLTGPDRPSDPSGLAGALNRLGSAVCYLELHFRSGKLAWKVRG